LLQAGDIGGEISVFPAILIFINWYRFTDRADRVYTHQDRRISMAVGRWRGIDGIEGAEMLT
jgi:hypothetical protein